MSEFKGVLAAIPGVSCDEFTGVNLHSDQYFLSHCHEDHMAGMDRLVPTLRRKNVVRVNHRIYCSGISKTFLVKKFAGLDERYVKVLEPNVPVVIDVFDKAKKSMFKLRVVGIPSNHCPGSIMFLFETTTDSGNCKARILYTGDFRFEELRLETLSALHDSVGRKLNIDQVYLDTTFCSTSYNVFPSRTTAIKRIWELVHDWIKKNGMYRRRRDKHVVLFHFPAQYGSESILRSIYQQSGGKWKIHVDETKRQEYLCIPDFADCTASDKTEAQWIHACSWKEDKRKKWKKKNLRTIPCEEEGSFEVRLIRPCAMYFRNVVKMDDKVVKCVGSESYKVCYSCHSSLSELKEFVKYFQPRRIVPCVVPKEMSKNGVLNLLNHVLDEPLGLHAADDVVNVTEVEGRSPLASSPDPSSPAGQSDDRQDTQMLFLEAFSSPVKSPASPEGGGRKRKISFDDETSQTSSTSSKRRMLSVDKETFFRKISFDPECSKDDDDEACGRTPAAEARRNSFQSSRRSKSAYSMPVDVVCGSEFDDTVQNVQSRRASLPHNLKIPAITITPSSPSPDPNHPDYPEFFEDRLYLETSKNKRTASGSSDLLPAGNQGCESEASRNTSEASVIILDELDSKQELRETQSTPDLDTILTHSQSVTERENCLNYAKGLALKASRE